MKEVQVVNRSRPLAAPLTADYCETFACRLRGLAWRRQLPAGRGLILVDRRERRLGSAVHMLGMSFDLGILWINSSMQVVEKRLAHRWRPFFVPSKPAQFVLEFGAERLTEFSIGDQLKFEDLAQT